MLGAQMFTEQLSVVITKDPDSLSSGIAPILHSDNAYGHRESAITSILEKGWDKFGGTFYLPGGLPNERVGYTSPGHGARYLN